MDLTIGESGFDSRHLHCAQNDSEAHPATNLLDTADSVLGGAGGGNAYHSFPSSTEVKNVWTYTSTPPRSSRLGPYVNIKSTSPLHQRGTWISFQNDEPVNTLSYCLV
jgi:hypothetical protein